MSNIHQKRKISKMIRVKLINIVEIIKSQSQCLMFQCIVSMLLVEITVSVVKNLVMDMDMDMDMVLVISNRTKRIIITLTRILIHPVNLLCGQYAHRFKKVVQQVQ
jgi:hypothetical protein